MAQLRKSDLVKNWLLGYSSETCYNYERLQALGNANAFIPIIKQGRSVRGRNFQVHEFL